MEDLYQNRRSININASVFHKVRPARKQRPRNDRDPIPRFKILNQPQVLITAVYNLMAHGVLACVHIGLQPQVRILGDVISSRRSSDLKIKPCPRVVKGAMFLRITNPPLVMAPDCDSNLFHGVQLALKRRRCQIWWLPVAVTLRPP